MSRCSGARSIWPFVAVLVAALVAGALLGRSDRGSGGSTSEVASTVDGVAHVHGLGVNPADGTLYAATHYGLFRVPADGRATRVGDKQQDTMGFTVVGPDHFLGSGHPDPTDRDLRQSGKPPLLGLIESRDAGATWTPQSLLGEADFHSLVAAHGKVYGFDSTGGRFMVSADGRSWQTRSRVPMSSFAVDPGNGDHVVAMTEQGLVESGDGGTSFQPLSGPTLVFLSWNVSQGLWGVSPTGEVYTRAGAGWLPRQPIGGRPQAILVTDDELYAAAEIDGASNILVSRDGAQSWTTRYRDPGS